MMRKLLSFLNKTKKAEKYDEFSPMRCKSCKATVKHNYLWFNEYHETFRCRECGSFRVEDVRKIIKSSIK